MNFKTIFTGFMVIVIVAIVALAVVGGLEKNDVQNWQVVQPLRGRSVY